MQAAVRRTDEGDHRLEVRGHGQRRTHHAILPSELRPRTLGDIMRTKELQSELCVAECSRGPVARDTAKHEALLWDGGRGDHAR